ncbi:MAG: Lrp/AsnC family transcriptional regulator for asnA, asnC and gidA [Halobacteriales archaeon]|jgi:Lrp/AsnC family transcriptional regulator for asnA, asnC and gidA
MQLDDTDREILRILQEDARTPFSEIARRIDMSSATVHDRVNRMKENGVITGYHAEVDPKAVGYDVSAVVGFRVEQGRETAVLDRLSDVDGMQEIHLTTGDWDVIAKLFVADAEELKQLLFDRIADMDGVIRSNTMVVLDTPHESEMLPV